MVPALGSFSSSISSTSVGRISSYLERWRTSSFSEFRVYSQFFWDWFVDFLGSCQVWDLLCTSSTTKRMVGRSFLHKKPNMSNRHSCTTWLGGIPKSSRRLQNVEASISCTPLMDIIWIEQLVSWQHRCSCDPSGECLGRLAVMIVKAAFVACQF